MNKRTILAFALAGLFFVVYSFGLNLYYAKYGPPRPASKTETTQVPPAAEQVQPPAQTAEQPAAQPEPEPEAKTPAPLDAAVTPDRYKPENVDDTPISIANDVITAVFTPRAGSIKSVTLNLFENLERNGKLVLLTDFREGLYPTALTKLAGADMERAGYVRVEPTAAPESDKQQIAFMTEVSGVRITKTYTLYSGKYGIGLDVTVENTRESPLEIDYELYGPTGIPVENESNKGMDVQYVSASSLESGQATAESFRPTPAWQLLSKDFSTAVNAKVVFVGTVNQYFASVLHPLDGAPVKAGECFAIADSESLRKNPQTPTIEEVRKIPSSVPDDANIFRRISSGIGRWIEGRRDLRSDGIQKLQPVYFRVAAKVTTGKFQLEASGGAGSSATHQYLVYCGPKDKDALAAFDAPQKLTGFQTLLDYGKYLDWFVRLLLFMLDGFHRVIPNWGVAIILLTMVVRAAMHVFTRRSQVSMAKMQKLQPEINKLKEKYKNDKQKLGQEQMKLMKEKGANPLGGCLPMLIQLPVFFALYRAINVSIELRQAPFMMWINDLARPDRLFTFAGVTLPVIHNEINLLPLLMMAAMLVQTKMSPPPATPEAAQQQKIMGFFMPIFIGVLLYRVASGLNLYIFTSTAIGVVEQWAIRRHIEAKGLA